MRPDTLDVVGRRVLLLGGTAEARVLASRLSDAGADVISSLAGRIADPRLPPGSVRIGGFGGAAQLALYLRREQIAAVIDATHPFAARITEHAAQACTVEAVPLLILTRPAWVPEDGDRWILVPSMEAAASAVPEILGRDGRVFLTIGRQGASAFRGLPQRFWIRALEPPDGPMPLRHELVLQRGPFQLDDERKLLRDLAIDLLVSKNSGGTMTSAKLHAARELKMPVLMINRPALPDAISAVDSVDAAAAWGQSDQLG
jgi:precorrin-6A/cobalt-precorrin-6A reductase